MQYTHLGQRRRGHDFQIRPGVGRDGLGGGGRDVGPEETLREGILLAVAVDGDGDGCVTVAVDLLLSGSHGGAVGGFVGLCVCLKK